jgi:hypothetical protein
MRVRKTRHHIPPRNPDKHPRKFKWLTPAQHEAYHTLFGAPKSFEDAVLILWQVFWDMERRIHDGQEGYYRTYYREMPKASSV